MQPMASRARQSRMAPAGVGVEIDDSPCPGTQFCEPTTEVRANQLVLDALKIAVLRPVGGICVGVGGHVL